jgi:hypothetical protein
MLIFLLWVLPFAPSVKKKEGGIGMCWFVLAGEAMCWHRTIHLLQPKNKPLLATIVFGHEILFTDQFVISGAWASRLQPLAPRVLSLERGLNMANHWFY